MFKKAYNVLKNNTIFIQPMLLWQIAFAAVMLFTANRIQLFIPRITLWISIILLFIACLSGWMYINKYAVLTYNEKDSSDETTAKTIQNFKKFFEGIGADFFRFLFASIVTAGIYFAAFYCIYKFCLTNYGIPLFLTDFINLSQTGTKEQLIQFISTIPENDKLIFSKWVLTINLALSVLNFFSLLYFTVMSFERKNFIISVFTALKFFIKNIFEAIGIMIFVFFLYFLINIISVLFGLNSLLFAILIIIITLYFNYYVLLVFCFYYDKTQNNSNNRPEFIREDSLSNSTGKDS